MRRSLVPLILCSLAVLAVAGAPKGCNPGAEAGPRKPLPTLSKSPGPFVFVSLPDTQVYAENRFPDGRNPVVTDERGTGAIFFDQTRWIVKNRDELGIRYVGHLGDIVQDGNDLVEWALAEQAMGLLRDADIPHGTAMGNHDDNVGTDYMRNYLDHFGPAFFEDRPWFTAASEGGGGNFQRLEHGNYKIGFLNLSIDHPQAELDWAQGIVEANPDTIFIVGTHRYLYDFKIAGGRYGEEVSTLLGDINLVDGDVPGVVDGNSAQQLFTDFVNRHPNVLMIHAGHFHAEWLRLDGTNGAGHLVAQILTDYQSTRNGGDGWLRVYELDFDAGTFSFDTYSPTLDRYRSTIDHYIETIYLAYDQRGQVMDVLGVDEQTYFNIIFGLLKDGPAPDGFLLQHPDLDEPHEQAYFQQYYDDLFMGDPPEGFEDFLEWENLWLIGFAADASDPFDFGDAVRSPRHTLDVAFQDYFAASSKQTTVFRMQALYDALQGLDPVELRFASAKTSLSGLLDRAYREVLAGEDAAAAATLLQLRSHTDGCADRGSPDDGASTGELPAAAKDWIVDCDAQERIDPRILELTSGLDAGDA